MTNFKSNPIIYPAINIREAIEKTRLILKEHSTHPTEKTVIAKTMKYGGLNGYSYGVLSALIQYGLLENVDKKLKVSNDANDIISQRLEEKEELKVVKKLAFNPPVFRELHKSYPNNLPDNDTLELHLVEEGLNPRVIDSLIHSYRSTIEFVNQWAENISVETINKQQAEELMQTPSNTNHSNTMKNNASASTQEEVWNTVLSVPTKDCAFRITSNGYVTQEAIEKLIANLNLIIDEFPKREV